MNDDGATPGRKLTPSEARTIRQWIIGSVCAGIITTIIAPATGSNEDVLVTSIAAATFGTGAIVIRSPAGFRAILAAFSLTWVGLLITIVADR